MNLLKDAQIILRNTTSNKRKLIMMMYIDDQLNNNNNPAKIDDDDKINEEEVIEQQGREEETSTTNGVSESSSSIESNPSTNEPTHNDSDNGEEEEEQSSDEDEDDSRIIKEPSLTIEFTNITYEEEQHLVLYLQNSLARYVASRDKSIPLTGNSMRKLTIYPDYIIDPNPNRYNLQNGQVGDIFNDRIKYERRFDKIVNKCWNCGRPDHDRKSCPFPRDEQELNKHQRAFQVFKASFGEHTPANLRYYGEDVKSRKRDISRNNKSNKRTDTSSNSDDSESDIILLDDANYTIENKVHTTDAGQADLQTRYGKEIELTPEVMERKEKRTELFSKLKNRSKEVDTMHQSQSFIGLREPEPESRRNESRRSNYRKEYSRESGPSPYSRNYQSGTPPRTHNNNIYQQSGSNTASFYSPYSQSVSSTTYSTPNPNFALGVPPPPPGIPPPSAQRVQPPPPPPTNGFNSTSVMDYNRQYSIPSLREQLQQNFTSPPANVWPVNPYVANYQNYPATSIFQYNSNNDSQPMTIGSSSPPNTNAKRGRDQTTPDFQPNIKRTKFDYY
jgi:hypothetical protein